MSISSEKPVRLFIAANPGDAVRAEMVRLQGRLERELAGTSFRIRWVDPEAMHLTFLFLGEQSAEKEGSLLQAMARGVAGFPPAALKLSGTGCFGRPSAPRVLWVGVDSPAVPGALHRRLANALEAAEERPFHPHFTLGRVRAGRGSAVFHALRKLPVEPVPFVLESVELIRSNLTPSGPRYEVIGCVPLAATAG